MTTNSDPPRLLSVEDNPETRLLLEHLLSGSYEIELVPTAEAAAQAIGESDFDLLLVDINLENDVGGAELLQRLREEDAVDIPAIAVTAYAMPGDREEFLEEGFDQYVSKPFSAADLREAISRALSSAG